MKCFEFSFNAGDIGNVLANGVRVPQAYLNLLSGGLKGVPTTLTGTLKGLFGGLRSKGNLLTKVTGALRGATGGAVTGLQTIYAIAIANVLKCK